MLIPGYRVHSYALWEYQQKGQKFPWQQMRTQRIPACSMAWWRHQMETFSALLALCAGNSPVPVNPPHKGQWRGALMFPLIYAWINDWVNNREAGDLRRQRGHYDVIVMVKSSYFLLNILLRLWLPLLFQMYICDIQSSAVITTSNLSWYYIRHCDNSDKKLIRY